MALWAVIPIKPLRKGKSRLSGVLSDSERESLNKTLMSRTIQCIQSLPQIDETVLISSDPAVLSFSQDLGIRTIHESSYTNLNNALRKATQAINSFHVDQLLILPADLPFLEPLDISGLLDLISTPPEIIISPDRAGKGTNALLTNPIGVLDYDYGNWSFRKHIEQAERKKIKVKIYNNDNIAFDLDTPEEIEQLVKDNKLSDLLIPHH